MGANGGREVAAVKLENELKLLTNSGLEASTAWVLPILKKLERRVKSRGEGMSKREKEFNYVKLKRPNAWTAALNPPFG